MRVYSLALTLLFLIALGLDGEAYTKPKDVYGWENLKWGMQSSEVESVLGKDIKKRKARVDEEYGIYTNLELRDISIGGKKFRASFWMDGDTKGLTKIVFVPQSEAEGYNWVETFISVEESLAGMYGAPDVEETSNDPGTSAERVWNFPSTEIEMSYLKIDDAELFLLVFSGKANSEAQR